MNQFEGLVLQSQEYKENDAIVHVLGADRILSVYARGVQKQTSKNRRIILPFSLVKLIVDHKEQREMDLLIKGELIEYFYKVQDSLLGQSLCFVCNDLLMRTKILPYYQSLMLALYRSIENKSQDMYSYVCFLIASILKEEGLAPEVDCCVIDQQTSRIETFSIEEGGFLCSECNGNRYPKWKKSELIKIRSLFKAQPKDMDYLFSKHQYDLEDVLLLLRWYERHTQIELSSVRFLKSIHTVERA